MCGIFGAVARVPEAEADIGAVTHVGLLTLQHRGQEGAGISVSCGESVETHRGMGTAKQVFGPGIKDEALIGFIRNQPEGLSFREIADLLGKWRVAQYDRYRDGEESAVLNPPEEMSGRAAIGHVRYSTQGASGSKNLQPIPFVFRGTSGAIGHNGNLVGLDVLRDIIYDRDPHFVLGGDADTELIAGLLATSGKAVFEEALSETLNLLAGAFSLVILYGGVVYAARDRFGIRPLVVGYNDRYLFASSETCTLDMFGVSSGNTQRISPGTVLRLDSSLAGPFSAMSVAWTSGKMTTECRDCIFEKIYIARPDSRIDDESFSTERMRAGRQLAREHPIGDTDVIVVPVIDSGGPAAQGYAEELGLPLRQALVRGRVEERTFIQPDQAIREWLQRLKLNPIIDQVEGKHVILVDDSIVRGTTSRRIVARVYGAGARKVSMVIASPPIMYPCHLGVDTPHRAELLAPGKSTEDIRRIIGAHYLGYLSHEGLDIATTGGYETHCTGCLTNIYPVPPDPK